MADDIFNDTNLSSPDAAFEALVGEGKKYTSPQEMAKAYLHADQTITQRNKELQELREELNVRKSVEEQLRNVAPRQAADIPPRVDNPPVVANEAPKFTDEDLDKRIRETLKQDRDQQSLADNLNIVSEKMIEVFGGDAKAKEVLTIRAQELGVSVEFLRSVAAQSPKAFYAQLGLDDAPKSTPNVTRPEVNSATLAHTSGGAKPGTYEFYEAIRKTDSKLYYAPATQAKLMQDAMNGTYIPK